MAAFARLASFIHGKIDGLRRRMDPIGHARRAGVKIGKDCRLINVDFGSEPWLVTLGDHVSASNTSFVTHDGGVWVFRDDYPDIDLLRPVEVGSNVFFGDGCRVLPGAKIGSNVVIGAGAIVAGTIPDNCVAAGVPARVIRPLDEYRKKVLELGTMTKNLSQQEKRRLTEGKIK